MEPGAEARKKPAWRFILMLVMLSTALVVGCGGGDEGVASLGEGRGYHTATLLADGRVLIAGGQLGSGPIASAEVYDPTTDTWISAGSMTKVQSWHTATLLKDGRLLSVGDSSVELYDPSTGTWTPAASMIFPRGEGHTATLLEDGRVLVAGGPSVVDDTVRDVALTELYDPSTGEWALTGDMTETREKHKAVLLKDGSVLVMGGRSTEVFDPATGIWSKGGSFTQGHGKYYTATLLADGRVLVAGGQLGSHDSPRQAYQHTDLFDPSTGEWSAAADMTTIRFSHTATLLKDGRVLVVGYHSGELYDPDADTWSSAGKMSRSRGRSHTATLLEDGRVLIAGGLKITTNQGGLIVKSEAITSVEVYDPAKGW